MDRGNALNKVWSNVKYVIQGCIATVGVMFCNISVGWSIPQLTLQPTPQPTMRSINNPEHWSHLSPEIGQQLYEQHMLQKYCPDCIALPLSHARVLAVRRALCVLKIAHPTAHACMHPSSFFTIESSAIIEQHYCSINHTYLEYGRDMTVLDIARCTLSGNQYYRYGYSANVLSTGRSGMLWSESAHRETLDYFLRLSRISQW